jgi:hypothetical protein
MEAASIICARDGMADILFGCCINGDGVMNTQLANANSLAKNSFSIIDNYSVDLTS